MHKLSFPICVIVAIFLLQAVALGQNATGAIGGTVNDSAGGRIPGATVAAVNVSTNLRHAATSTDTGTYQLLQLTPGIYDLIVEAKGFKTAQLKAVQVQVADRLTLDFSLEVGQLSDTVTVTGEVPLLRMEDAQVGQIVDSLMITNLPQLDRNPLQLLRLSGNISGNGNLNSDTRINGGRSVGIEYLVDGASIMTGKAHNVGMTSIPDMETVSEFKVITNGMSAEYGRASGGLVEVATKSGSNQLHGQLFEYFHNQLLNANSWEQNWSSEYVPGKKAERSVFHQNDYGFLVSGPVFLPKVYNGKDRTFFLFDYEGFRKRTGKVNQLGAVPTEAERSGDFTNSLYAGEGAMMWDPLGNIGTDAAGNFIKTTPLGGDGKHIPADRIDPVAKRVLEITPLPNHTPTPGYSDYNNYIGQTKQVQDRDSYNVRIDHNFTDRHHTYVRFNRMNYQNLQTQWFSALRPDKGDYSMGSISSSAGWDWTVSPTTVLNVRASLIHNPGLSTPKYNFTLDGWELDPVMLQMENYMPNISFRTWSADPAWGGQNFLGGDQTFPAGGPDTTYTFAASVSKIYHRHTIKTGVEHHRFYSNHFEQLSGTINYYGAGVDQQNSGDPFWASPRMNSLGSFLLGIPDSANNQQATTMANSVHYYAAFVQDDFKVSQRLTLNLGLRWDMDTPLSGRTDKLFGWDPNAASPYSLPAGWTWNGALNQAGLTAAQIASLPEPAWAKSGKFPNGAGFFVKSAGHSSRLASNYHPWHFAPRLGMAYRLDASTVLRASWGMSYITQTGDYWAGWVSGADSVSSTVFDRNPVNGNVEHSNMSLFYPQEYVHFVPTNAALNQNLLGYAGCCRSLWNKDMDMPREYNFGVSLQRQFHSLLLELGWSGNHSSTLLATNPSTVFPASLINPQYTTLLATAVANPLYGQVQDTNNFTHSSVPLGALLMDNPAFGGFGISGQNIGRSNYNALNLKIEKRISHGIAFLLNYSFSKSLDNVGNLAGDQGEKSYQSYDSADAGMAPSNILPVYPWIRNPSSTGYDASLMKNFQIRGEGTYLQFRIEAQNLFNIRGFGTYNTNYDSPTFGLITASAQNPRNLQISARLVF